jgi:rubredoxin
MTNWKCSKCSYTLEAETYPDKCPGCHTPCEFLNITCYTPDCKNDGLDKRIGEEKND